MTSLESFTLIHLISSKYIDRHEHQYPLHCVRPIVWRSISRASCDAFLQSHHAHSLTWPSFSPSKIVNIWRANKFALIQQGVWRWRLFLSSSSSFNHQRRCRIGRLNYLPIHRFNIKSASRRCDYGLSYSVICFIKEGHDHWGMQRAGFEKNYRNIICACLRDCHNSLVNTLCA